MNNWLHSHSNESLVHWIEDYSHKLNDPDWLFRLGVHRDHMVWITRKYLNMRLAELERRGHAVQVI